jgi:hypothetical protein
MSFYITRLQINRGANVQRANREHGEMKKALLCGVLEIHTHFHCFLADKKCYSFFRDIRKDGVFS